MLRKKSRLNSSKQAPMADHGSQQYSADKYRKPSSSFFSSPRLFTGFTSKASTETETMTSPTSILDTKPFSALKTKTKTPFWSENPTPKSFEPDSKRVGLGLVDALIDENSDPKLSKPESRMVLFGSQLKIQIPSGVLSPSGSPKSPADFGIKTRNSQLGCFSPYGSSNSGLENPNSLSASEMELSEDYTRVIAHGPNPRTIHIFDDCIVDSCCGVVGFSGSRKQNGFLPPTRTMSYPSESFLSFCYNCKKNLGQGKDIYMYRGEKAFCSSECRCKEIMSDEGME